MSIPEQTKKEILETVKGLDRPPTIKQIEEHVGLERHTLSKYLGILQREGTLDYESVGRAKLWRINDRPLKTIFETPESNHSFAEGLLVKLLNRMPAGVFVLDESCRIGYLNDLMREMYGDVEGRPLHELLLGESGPSALGAISDVAAGEIGYGQEEITDLDGNVLDVRAVAVRKPSDGLLTVLIVEDMTHARRVERALRRSERMYRSLVEASLDGVYSLDKDGVVTFVSKRLAKMLGQQKKGIVGRPLLEFVEERDRDGVEADLVSKGRTALECSLVRADGNAVRVRIDAVSVTDGLRRPTGFVGFVRSLQ